MKVIIIGAGASGITAAISLKRKYKDVDVLVIEHLDKPLKKILATGNGKCNLGNANINVELYNNSSFVKPILDEYDFDAQRRFFESINVKTKLVGDLLYPISESALTVRNALLKECNKLGIKINVSESIIDYKVGSQIEVTTDKGEYVADKLIFATGAKSSPQLGSDGSVYSLLKKHNYNIKDINPGLCPIITKEKTKLIDGVRVKANVSLLKEGKLIHQEEGEVLFKEHGLSGIVIMNISSSIARDLKASYQIKIDQLPNIPYAELVSFLKSHSKEEYLDAYFHPKMALYLKDVKDVIKASKELTFAFDKLDDFTHSQVSVGGLSLKEVNSSLMSKKEKGVYFLGELLDVDGPCGGYNLMWAFATGLFIK